MIVSIISILFFLCNRAEKVADDDDGVVSQVRSLGKCQDGGQEAYRPWTNRKTFISGKF